MLLNIGIILLGAVQYGFHIAVINGLQCTDTSSPSSCILLDDERFSLMVSAFLLGGFIGCFNVSRFSKPKPEIVAAASVLVGDLLLSMADGFFLLSLARLLIGLGCGVFTVTVPLALARESKQGRIGILNQLFICLGILFAQLISIPFAGDGSWRWLPLFSAAISLIQLSSVLMISQSEELEDAESLLSKNEEILDIKETLFSNSPLVRSGVILNISANAFQQLTGINAVMFYSTSILERIIPGSAREISIFVAVVNVASVAVPILLIDKIGRKKLLLSSMCSMAVFSFALAYSLNNGMKLLASISIIAFVAAFASGLGPIPFLLLSESPNESKKSSASIGLAVAWGNNILVGALFLPLRALLSNGGNAPGNIFYLFFALAVLGTLIMNRLL